MISVEIGKPQRTVVIEPLYVPIPQKRADPAEKPAIAEPEREKAPA